MTLTTERLILRCPSAADVDRVLSICEDPEIVAFTTVPHPYRLEDAKTFVTEIIPAGWASGTGLAWGMYAKDQNELLGLVSL
ncbi:MAG: GNAT family N-acetyltransferase, partial [Arthrobacter sp.]|nr:GNAT family N-acetyltransferase [Arthrobacter sp.]